MTVFLRILEPPVDEKPAALLRAVTAFRSKEMDEVSRQVVFERAPAAFAEVPGAPFAYWVSEAVREIFGRLGRLEANGRTVKQGLATRDDFRFVRTWWEVEAERGGAGPKWPPFAKGGAFSSFYSDLTLAVQWDAEAQASYAERTSNFNVLLTSSREEFLYRAGLTWPRRTNGLSFRVLPRGCVFADKGPVAFIKGDDPVRLAALAAVVNSKPFGYLMAVQLARTELAQSYEVGLVQQTPVPALKDEEAAMLATLARRAWSLKRSLDTTNQTSHAFLLPRGPNEKVTGLDRGAVERELDLIQQAINEAAFRLYNIGVEDRAIIEASSKRGAVISGDSDGSGDEDDNAGEDEAPTHAATDTLISWLVGVAFGRFDARLATGERAIPPEPEPFDPFPSRSPGMWPEGEERDELPPDILVDDSGHRDDICAHVADAAAKTGWPDHHDLRPWLAREFFPLHIKMYSKSRRRAPIYWQLATPSASYSVWLYVHAFSNDTLFRVQNDYAAPKLAHEERRLEAMALEVRNNASAADRKAIAAQQVFVEELRAFHDEVKCVAPLWARNLDDGVAINFAPLWRLVPQYKPWQKELKATWDALCAGHYDWSHLAMHLWPERVTPKCATDRSLAVAHGVEDVFWVQGVAGKWKARATPSMAVDQLVSERSSSAVKAALKSLLDAPTASGTGRARGRRAAASATTDGGIT